MGIEKEIEDEGIWFVYQGKRILGGITYWTDREGLRTAERILRNEFGLVDELPPQKTKGLVLERGGYKTGFCHFHLFEIEERPFVYFHYWLDKLEPNDFEIDQVMPIARRLYEAIQPKKVTLLYSFSMDLPVIIRYIPFFNK